jgi:hypothetical protein
LVVLDGPFANVRIVEPIDITWAHVLKWVGFENWGHHPWPTGGDMTADDAAARIVDADKIVLLLLDEGRHGAAFH